MAICQVSSGSFTEPNGCRIALGIAAITLLAAASIALNVVMFRGIKGKFYGAPSAQIMGKVTLGLSAPFLALYLLALTNKTARKTSTLYVLIAATVCTVALSCLGIANVLNMKKLGMAMLGSGLLVSPFVFIALGYDIKRVSNLDF